MTPEERKALRGVVSRVWKLSASTVAPPRLTLPESEGAAAAMRMFKSSQDALGKAVLPLVGLQGQVNAMFRSSAFQDIMQKQARVVESAARLVSGIDLSFLDNAAKALGNFIEQQSSWLELLGPAMAAMRASFYPPNLRSIHGLTFDLVETVVMSEGIPLYGVPRTATAEALIRADGPRERRDILGARWKSISVDCRGLIDSCSSKATPSSVGYARAALDALDAGHSEAAQALAASIIDTVVREYFGSDRYKYTPQRNGKRTTDAYYELAARDLLAFAPIWQTYQQFEPANGDKVPTTFSRHATAHAVSRRQFSRRNAIQSLMFACSLLYRIDEKSGLLRYSSERK